MNRTTLIAFTAGSLVTAGAALIIGAGPEHKHHDDDHKMHEMQDHKMMDKEPSDHMAEMSAEEMMAGMMKLSTPNEHHAELMSTVGSWSAKTSFVMDPAAPPMEGPASMTVTEMLDGRYAMSHFKMDFMGQPFEGYSIIGYDNAHEQYCSIWMDSMSTKLTYMTGNKDEDGNLVMHGISTTPMGDNPMKIVTTKIDEDHWTDKFYDKMPDGTWFNSGTIHYTRD